MARTRDERYAHQLPEFANRLRRLRLQAGLTQDQLAEASGLSVTMVQNLERPSDGGNPRLTTLYALAEALRVKSSSLLED